MPRPSQTQPKDTFPMFHTQEPFKAVAKMFGLSPNTLRTWWVAQFGLDAFRQRGAQIHREAAARVGRATGHPSRHDGLKRCSKCENDKPMSDFSVRSSARDGRAPWCFGCSRQYQKDKKYKRAALVERRRLIADLKDKPCADCKGRFPSYVMDFDHVRGEKETNVSAMVGCKMERLLDEVGKCDVVCANCHRIRTYERRNGG